MRKHQTHPQCRGWHRSAYWWQLHCIYLHWSSPPLWSPPEAQKNLIQPLDYNNNNNSSFISSLTVYFKSSGLTRTLSTHGGIFSFITMVVSDKVRQGRLYISPQEKRHSARFPQKFNQWQLKTRWFSLKTNKSIIHNLLSELGSGEVQPCWRWQESQDKTLWNSIVDITLLRFLGQVRFVWMWKQEFRDYLHLCVLNTRKRFPIHVSKLSLKYLLF